MRILLAVDGASCSAAAIDTVIAQAHPSDTEILVLHAVEWPFGGPPYLHFSVGPRATQGILRLRERALDAGEALVTQVATRLRLAGFCASSMVKEGDARSVIVNAATTWNADFIVMGTHGRRGLDRLALGSVAESVLRRAPCSVAVVRAPTQPAGATTVIPLNAPFEGPRSSEAS